MTLVNFNVFAVASPQIAILGASRWRRLQSRSPHLIPGLHPQSLEKRTLQHVITMSPGITCELELLILTLQLNSTRETSSLPKNPNCAHSSPPSP